MDRRKSLLLPCRMETARLILRPYVALDAAVLLQAITKERERLGSILAEPVLAMTTVAEAESLIARLHGAWKAAHQFIISLWEKTSSLLVGEAYLGGFEHTGQHAEIGIFLMQPFEGRGLAREALDACIRAAAQSLHVHTLHYRCDADNARSQDLALRTGFSLMSEHGPTRVNRYGSGVPSVHFRLDLKMDAENRKA
ncbi:MAG: GNAT family N-acetyltransferase [Bryobacteraceae bacterium]